MIELLKQVVLSPFRLFFWLLDSWLELGLKLAEYLTDEEIEDEH